MSSHQTVVVTAITHQSHSSHTVVRQVLYCHRLLRFVNFWAERLIRFITYPTKPHYVYDRRKKENVSFTSLVHQSSPP